jgi:hypothetical protein
MISASFKSSYELNLRQLRMSYFGKPHSTSYPSVLYRDKDLSIQICVGCLLAERIGEGYLGNIRYIFLDKHLNPVMFRRSDPSSDGLTPNLELVGSVTEEWKNNCHYTQRCWYVTASPWLPTNWFRNNMLMTPELLAVIDKVRCGL